MGIMVYSGDGLNYTQRRRVSTVIFVNGEHQDEAPADPAQIDPYEGGDPVFYGLLERKEMARVGFSLNGRPDLLAAFDSTGDP